MKSITSADLDKISQKTYLYSIGGRYKHDDKLATSLNYLYSNYKKNVLKATTWAVDYKFVPGLMSYGEITYYTTNGKFLENSLVKTDKTNGKIFIVGTKIEF